MGVIVNHGNELKSNLFSCFNYSNERNSGISNFGEIKVNDNQEDKSLNYFRISDMVNAPQKFTRSYSLIDKYNSKNNLDQISIRSNYYQINYREENIYKFQKEKYESNPKIRELERLMGKDNNFELTEKESFYIKNKLSQNYLVKKLFHYNDNSYYLGYVNKKNKMRDLFGTFYYNDGSIYKGFFENDKINGRGRLLLIDRYIYEGDFEDGSFNGYGKLYAINGIKYIGNWKNDMQEGLGIEKHPDGTCYTGTYIKGMKTGKGKYVFKNGDIYEGDFLNEEMTGWGMFKKKDGKIYYGMVKNHIIEGIGIFIWNDNKRYIGEYHNELKDGFGIFYSNDGKFYAGYWKDGKQDGYGVLNNILGQKYYLKYKNGLKVPMPLLSDEDKKGIDDLILEGEKKIDIEKLNKKAHEIIIQKENEKKEIKIIENNININNNSQNSKDIYSNKNRISENMKSIQTYNNISDNFNNINTNNKNYEIKNDEISNNISPFKIDISNYDENNNSLNNIQMKNVQSGKNKNLNKSIYSKNEGDNNTAQTSKLLGDIIIKYKNKSSINLNAHAKLEKNDIKMMKNKSETKIININMSF